MNPTTQQGVTLWESIGTDVKFCVVLPEPPKAKKFRRQSRRDGGYDMVPAYSEEELLAYGQACHEAAISQPPAPEQASGESVCPDCHGSEFHGFKRGVRCKTCDGLGLIATPAAPEAAKCDPTQTECPRCKNNIAACDGVFAAKPGHGWSATLKAASEQLAAKPEQQAQAGEPKVVAYGSLNEYGSYEISAFSHHRGEDELITLQSHREAMARLERSLGIVAEEQMKILGECAEKDAALKACEKDAARYRLLRTWGVRAHGLYVTNGNNPVYDMSLDALLDAAIMEQLK